MTVIDLTINFAPKKLPLLYLWIYKIFHMP